MTVEITKCVVLHRKYSADMICLKTNLPSPCPKVVPDPADLVIMHVEVDTGEEYCRVNFPGVPVEVINA